MTLKCCEFWFSHMRLIIFKDCWQNVVVGFGTKHILFSFQPSSTPNTIIALYSEMAWKRSTQAQLNQVEAGENSKTNNKIFCFPPFDGLIIVRMLSFICGEPDFESDRMFVFFVFYYKYKHQTYFIHQFVFFILSFFWFMLTNILLLFNVLLSFHYTSRPYGGFCGHFVAWK